MVYIQDNKTHEAMVETKIRIRCRFCDKLMNSNKCKCGASYKIDKTFGNFLVWRKKKYPNKIKGYRSKYYTSPKGIISYTNHNHRRLALIKQRPCDLSNEKVKELFDRDKVCVYCGSNNNLELDHIIPLKLGGNSLFNNFVLACDKCNRSKSGRDVFKWCKLQGIGVPKIVLELLSIQNSRH